MIFNITRASMCSSWPRDKCPCEGAVLKDDNCDNNWVIKIDTLEQLVNFFDDTIILDGETITIYDDYVE